MRTHIFDSKDLEHKRSAKLKAQHCTELPLKTTTAEHFIIGTDNQNDKTQVNSTFGVLLQQITHIHLPNRHEVCTLSDPFKDLLQLGVDEAVICE